MRKKKPRMGRPPLAPTKVKGRVVVLRVTEADYERFASAAKARGVSLGAWARDVLLHAAR